jgi:isopenicillin N synthase-like dioxygenase
VAEDLRARVRGQARAFFALPPETKQRYAVTVGGRGWLPPGVEANGYAEGTQTPPDLKESFAVGANQPTGDPEVDGYWFQTNVYPAEVPGLQAAVVGYLARWSGGRWKSNRHRVLPPQADAPDEDLVSLVYFYESDHDAVIESLRPPVGRRDDLAPVVSAQFLKERYDAIAIG